MDGFPESRSVRLEENFKSLEEDMLEPLEELDE
jgi:hypothetical protein